MRSARNIMAASLVLLTCSGAVLRSAIEEILPFQDFYQVQWAANHVDTLDHGRQVQLVMDRESGAGFQSKYMYTYGYFSMKIKAIPGNSAGTVTTYYLSSNSDNHDEMDFELLGNVTGQPYILQTNVFANGKGGREQRVFLWFDPTADFHTYSIIWNHAQIIFYIDNNPIRIFRNLQSQGVDYPAYQPVSVYSSVFEASSWATDGGRVPIDWNAAPFVASYSGFHIDGSCVNDGRSAPKNFQSNWWEGAEYQTLRDDQIGKLEHVRKNYLVFDYCLDRTRYPTVPTECAANYGT